MYDFPHTSVARIKARIDSLVTAYRAKLDAYRKPNGDPLGHVKKAELEADYRDRVTTKAKEKYVENKGLYLFYELPVAMLDLNVPAEFPWSNKSVNGVSTRRTFREYLSTYHISLDETKVLFRLAGTPVNGTRHFGVREEEIDLWKALFEAKGYDWGTVGDIAAYRQRLQSPAYDNGE